MLGGHDVSRLIGSPFSRDEQDEFGRVQDTRRLLPLPLPSAMEGRPPASKSPLFTLPPEILGEIMNLLVDEKATISALALVNSDCRQLARSCWFADVCFDYGPRSNQLLSHLTREACAKQNKDTPIRPPFIGSCIRRVTVRSDRDYVADVHSELYDSTRGDTARTVTAQERAELRKAATDYYFETHITSLLTAMSVMPNIESLVWYDKMCLDKSFFKCVTRLPLHHLKICNAYIGNPYCLNSLGRSVLSLKTLHLDILACYDKVHADDEISDDDELAWENKDLLPFMSCLLQGCSATLQHLTIRCKDSARYELLSFGHKPADFGQLQHLNLSGCLDDLDTVAWSSLLSSPLRHLALPNSYSRSFIQSINACQPLDQLQTLVLPFFGYKGERQAPAILNFISRHYHLRKLSVQNGEPQLMDSHLVPLLANGRWSNLTSLSLAWRGPDRSEEMLSNIASISTNSLAAIGSIKSLEQLYLTAGEIYGDRHQWLIDH
ncbi:hypothetical protein M419DRAFT_74030, partial [Trichoderma reesei RUT C-30]